MPTGTVKIFNPMKGYGFIRPDAGGDDVFMHIAAVARAGLLGKMERGLRLEFSTAPDERGRGLRAKDIVLLDATAQPPNR